MKPIVFACLSAALLCACASTPPPAVARLTHQTGTVSAPNPDTGTCMATDVTPAVIETVTERVMVQPPIVDSSGKVTIPGVYKTKSQPVIIEERREQKFEAICEAQLTYDFVLNLQRALLARGYYSGQPTGELNWRTRRGIRIYQLDQDIDSAILSVQTARALGLINYQDF